MQRRFSRALLFMLASPIIWAAHFVFIYAVNGVACARPALHGVWAGIPVSGWIIVAASVLALVAMALVYWRQRTDMLRTGEPGFLAWLARMLSLLLAVAVVWETMPVLLVPACI
jgi:hypothetical protein